MYRGILITLALLLVVRPAPSLPMKPRTRDRWTSSRVFRGAGLGPREYGTPAAADSMQKLADTGSEWVCIAFAPNMKTYDTPEIRFSDANPQMVTDDELRHAVDLARATASR